MMIRTLICLVLLSGTGLAQQQQGLVEKIANELADNATQSAGVGVQDPFTSQIDMSAMTGFLATLRMGAQRNASDVNAQTYQTVLALMEQGVDKQIGSSSETARRDSEKAP